MPNTDLFLDTLIETNRTHDFFVDWSKIHAYKAEYADELSLLSSVSGTGVDSKAELARLMEKYPRIIRLLPLLIAVRSEKTSHVVQVTDESTMSTINYAFGSSGMETEVQIALDFAERTGLIRELAGIKSPADYYFGVEVGMDTNGRKNRSGTAMENLVEPFVLELAENHNGKYLSQKNFATASRIFGVECPPDEASKRGDFMVMANGLPINIEVNYFDGGGSKQEIMNSYIPRAQNLAKYGWRFALVTDGQGWKKNRNQVELGYKRLKHIYNASMCRDGYLEKILDDA